jgi:hypothetical protein
VPELNFTDFHYTTIPDTSYSIQGVRFKVSLVCNGHIYKYVSLPISTFKRMQGKISPKDVHINDFYRIFNKILIDQKSPLQLHSIMFSHANETDGLRRFALIALGGKQTEVFMKESNFSYMLVSMDSYDSALTSTRSDSLIIEWRKIGLFTHLSNTEISKAIDEVEGGDRFSTSNLLGNFPGVIYSLDSVVMNPGSTNINMLTNFARYTHGAFNPVDIKQENVNGGIKLKYQFKGKSHTYTFNTNYSWLDAKFSTFIKGLGRENNLSGDFYQIRYSSSFIYLSKQQHDYIVMHKLLDFDPTK